MIRKSPGREDGVRDWQTGTQIDPDGAGSKKARVQMKDHL